MLVTRYKAHLNDQLAKLEFKNIESLSEKEWRNFNLPEIFTATKRGKRYKTSDHVPGDIPYVSSSGLNNGVNGFVSSGTGTRMFENCISLANSGTVGKAFYEPFPFIASDHVTSLTNPAFNQSIYMFLCAVLEQQRGNFSFNREINDSRIKRIQIMLPVDDSGKPDYLYMEQYIKNLMIKKYRQYLIFLEQR